MKAISEFFSKHSKDKKPSAESVKQISDYSLLELDTNNMEPFLPPLPHEVIFIILRLLSSKDLQQVAWVNTAGYMFACQIQILRYEKLLANSNLWRYLPTIADNKPEVGGHSFLDYAQTQTLRAIPIDQLSQFSTLSLFCTHMHNKYKLFNSWNSVVPNDHTVLIGLAKTLLRNRVSNNAKAPESLQEFMSLYSPQTTIIRKFQLWQLYSELESYLSTLFFFYRILLLGPLDPHRIIATITDPGADVRLTGNCLIALDELNPGTLATLLNKAISIHRAPNNSDLDVSLLKKIERLLERLTEADLLTYLNPYEEHMNRNLFVQAMQTDYEFLIKKLSIKVLLRLKLPPARFFQNMDKEGRLVHDDILPYLLSNSSLISKLSEQDLIQVLCEMDPDNIVSVLKSGPVLSSRLTVDVLDHWLDEDPMSNQDFVQKILINEQDLRFLDKDQIEAIKKRSSDSYNKSHIKNYDDFAILRKASHTFKGFQGRMPRIINSEGLIKAMEKLTSSQIYRAIYPCESLSYEVAQRYLNKLDISDLIKFTRGCLQNTHRFPLLEILFKTLPLELRARSDKLQSSDWLELAFIHPRLGVIIAKEHIRNLTDDDLTAFARTSRRHEGILMLASSERQERDQRRKNQSTEGQHKVAHDQEAMKNTSASTNTRLTHS